MGKKNFIGLSILLLVLLLGLSSTSYADTSRVWTKNEIKNIIYNFFTRSYYSVSQVESFVNSNDSIISGLADKMNNNPSVYIVSKGTGNGSMILFGILKANNINIYGSTSRLYTTGNSSNVEYMIFRIGFNPIYENNPNTQLFDGAHNQNWYYFSNNVYSKSNNTGTLLYSGSTFNPTSMINGPYLDAHFDFEYNMNQSFKDLHVGNDTYTLPIRQQGDNTLITLGELEQLEYLDYIMFEKMRYNKYTNMWETFYAENLFSGDWGTDDDILTVKVGGGNIGNILCQYTFYTNSNSFDDITAFYYVINLQTTYSGDVIDVSGTFGNDDYYNNYDDNINNIEQNQQSQDRTDDIINTITDDSKVDSLLGDFASGDIGEKMGYVEHSLPNVPDERNPSLLVMNLVNDFCDILIDDDNVYWDYSMHGETPTRIYASDFVTEETPLKVFIRLSMIFGSLFLIYIQFKHIIELINEGNAPKVLHDIDADVYFYKM